MTFGQHPQECHVLALRRCTTLWHSWDQHFMLSKVTNMHSSWGAGTSLVPQREQGQ